MATRVPVAEVTAMAAFIIAVPAQSAAVSRRCRTRSTLGRPPAALKAEGKALEAGPLAFARSGAGRTS
ncbi:hypothetical protein GCM10009678_37290 [Actinomadura kijaniata]